MTAHSGQAAAHPDPEPALRRRNIAIVQRESAAMGVVNAAGVFLPVFILRLGGSNLAVSLLSALPALAGFILSVPAGSFLQARRNVIPWYAAARAVQYLVYASIALLVALLPGDVVIPGILVLWAVITVPGSLSAVASNVVLNVAGPGGRYDLLSRRYGIMGLTTAIAVALVGQVLQALTFPLNFQVVFAALSVAGLVACFFSIRIRVPDQSPLARNDQVTARQRLSGYISLLRSQPRFVSFVSRRFLLSFGTGLTVPLVPLWYIREVQAPDAWIGVIGTCQSLGALAGYYAWRRLARRGSARVLLLAATMGIALYPAALAQTRDLVLICGIAVYGAVMAAGINLVLFDELMKTVPPGHLVTFSGVENSLGNLAAIVAPLTGAALSAAAGIGEGLLVGALVTLLGALLLSASSRDVSRGRT